MQFVHNKVVDFKTLDFSSPYDEATDGNGAQSDGPNGEGAERESSNALRSDRQRPDAQWREITWFCFVHT